MYNKITRNHVAAKAGVSSATVSRTYNRPNTVRPQVREQVLKAAGELGYVPDPRASSLRKGDTGIIGFIEKKKPVQPSDRFLDYLFAASIRAVQNALGHTRYRPALFQIESVDEIHGLASKRLCDGFIARDLQHPALLKAVKTAGLPYVCAFRESDDTLSQVRLHEEHGGFLAAERFLSAGRTRPAHVTGMLDVWATPQKRWQGFRSCYPDTPRLIIGELGIAGGYRSARCLIPDIRRKRIDSIFVVNDITAVGVVQALQEQGLRIPDDVSLISHDNLPIIDTLPVRLASIDMRFPEIYTTAVNGLLHFMESRTPVNKTIKPLFIEGASV